MSTVPTASSSGTSAQMSVTHINLLASGEDIRQAETRLDKTLTVPLSRPFTSFKLDWIRAPTLSSHWLELFVAVWVGGRFTVVFVDWWGVSPQSSHKTTVTTENNHVFAQNRL